MMKFIALIVCLIALIQFSSCDLDCKIYTNQTILGGLCPTPNYKIAPLLDFLNTSKTDDVSKEIQKYYTEVSKQMQDTLSYFPQFLRSSKCWATANNLVCGSILRKCEKTTLPDLSNPSPDFKLDPTSLGAAACVDQCVQVVEDCAGEYLSMIPIVGKMVLNMAKQYACTYVETMKLDFEGKKLALLAKAPNCTLYEKFSGASGLYPSMSILLVLAFIALF